MRRREAGLAYWLEAGPNQVQPPLLARWVKSFQKHTRGFTPAVAEFGLSIDVRVASPKDPFSACVMVRDGLGYWANPRDAKVHNADYGRCSVKSVNLLSQASCSQLPLPADLTVQVNSQAWLQAPLVRSIRNDFWQAKARLQDIACPIQLEPPRRCPLSLARSRTFVNNGLQRIAAVPQIGCPVRPAELKEAERESFLREAVALKNIASGQAELVAVFRSVPIELVAKLSFDEESGRVIYDLTQNPALRRTRVHDMAAVRDLSTKKIHLVAHRTRYRTVFLN